jgi:uncharacterized alpha-E superfamily protein
VTSRAAENLFWLGRYTERTENTLRLVRLSLDILASEDQGGQRLLQWIDQLARTHGLIPAAAPLASQSPRVFERNLIHSLWDSQAATSVGYNLRALVRSASNVRERLSAEHWQMLQHTETEFFRALKKNDAMHQERLLTSHAALNALNATSQRLAALTGFQTDRMSRDDGWRLLSIGRHIERLDFLADALTQALQTRLIKEQAGFDAVLRLFDSTISFHAQYQQSRTPAALLDMLVLDLDNPRSLSWVAHTLRSRLLRMEHLADAGTQQLAALVPISQQAKNMASAPSADVPALLAEYRQSARKVSEGLSSLFFTHSGLTAHSVST